MASANTLVLQLLAAGKQGANRGRFSNSLTVINEKG